jgi:peptidoglycan/xylan/chitin deacetylase (PgdA/CDA1 family)
VTAPSVPPGVAILMYHSIGPSTTAWSRRFTVDPGLFDEHIAALVEAPACLVAVREVPGLLSGRPTERPRERGAVAEVETSLEPKGAESATGQAVSAGPAVAISIDDGLADAATGAAPVLAAHRAPATLFVPTAYVGRSAGWMSGEDADRPMLSWGALEELAEVGMEIGSHGHLHLAADINEPELIREDAIRSRAELEGHLGRTVSSYAYPFGYCTRDAANAVGEAGFSQACAVRELPAVAGDDSLSLPRIYVAPRTTPEMLLRLVQRRPARPLRHLALVKQQLWQVGHRRAGWGPPEARSGSRARLASNDLGA